MSNDSDTRLYVIVSPNYALVASQLDPVSFGRHYAIGSSRYYQGTVIFAEIDSSYRHDFFRINELLEDVKAKPDGTPKRTKFIATYRVIEHVDMSAFRNLYVVSTEGEVLEMEQAPYDRKDRPALLRTYQEICPLSSIILSHMTPPEFGEYITDPQQPKGAPKVVYTQIDLDTDEFLKSLEENPFHPGPLPNVHPQKLREQILAIKDNPEKKTKGVTLDSAINKISFLKLRSGFWIASEGEMIYYPIPDEAALERDHYAFFRSVSG